MKKAKPKAKKSVSERRKPAPAPDHHDDAIGIAEVAATLQISERQVHRLVGQGMPKLGRGKFDALSLLEWRERVYWPRKLQRISDSGLSPLEREQARLTRAKADLVEIELKLARGSAIPIALFDASMRLQMDSVRHHLRDFHLVIAERLLGQDRTTIRIRLDQAIKTSLLELANSDPPELPPLEDEQEGTTL